MVYVDKAPPVRVIAVVTIFASTLDLLADLLICVRLFSLMATFNAVAERACYAYFVFIGVSIVVYIMEMIDVFLTLKYDQELPFYSRLAKSMVIAFEEVPLPICLCIIYLNKPPGTKISDPVMLASMVKLIALVWGVTKFIKLRFCWFCYPCIHDHGCAENMRRCVTPRLERVIMLIVNICHIVAILVVFQNILLSSDDTESDEAALGFDTPLGSTTLAA